MNSNNHLVKVVSSNQSLQDKRFVPQGLGNTGIKTELEPNWDGYCKQTQKKKKKTSIAKTKEKKYYCTVMIGYREDWIPIFKEIAGKTSFLWQMVTGTFN